ncbi:MAG: 23S rRNA (adenine(2503)-C(2))-methyltransferase RlmN, partial [bacterium]
MNNILDKTLIELQSDFKELKLPSFRAKQVFIWLHKKTVFNFALMTDLPESLRAELKNKYWIKTIREKTRVVSKDGTKKYLFELSEGYLIESVLLQNKKDRKTLCVSTQVGCNQACSFCATGTMGFKRNLEVSEIIGQVYEVMKENPELSNIVYMGMGEPFMNYENVVKSLRILIEPAGACFGQRRITVSTCGLPDKIMAFAREDFQVRLSVSLNAVDDTLRCQLMPVNRKHPLRELLSAIKYYTKKSGRIVTFEYIMIDGVNDSEADALKVVKICQGLGAKVNLIPYNMNNKKYKPSSQRTTDRFFDILTEHGVNGSLRYRKGEDISAA